MTAPRKPIGRPPKPEEPKGPEPYERREYRDRLQVIVDALEIGALNKDVALYLQMLLRRHDLLRASNAKRFPTTGEEAVTLLLRTVFETTNGAKALTLPILKAVSTCLHPVWVAKGLALLETFDRVDLVGLHATLIDLGLADQLDRALRHKLVQILGPPIVPEAPKKTLARSKTARPAWASEASWNDVLALGKRKPKRPATAVKSNARCWPK
jgi:hypothetical protein